MAATLSPVTSTRRANLARVSRLCAEGKHSRCLGSVFIYPAEHGQHSAPCQCPTPDCGHGTEAEKRRKD